MCYDTSFKSTVEDLGRYFQEVLSFDPALDLFWGNKDHIQGVSIFDEHPIIYRQSRREANPGQLTVRAMEWGCIPFYAKEKPDFKGRNTWLNIRSEKVLDDPKSYWNKIKNRRCLVPVTGIYEHRAIPGWKKKVPYLVRPADQELFFLPGLYSKVDLPDTQTGEVQEHWTFALITRPANSLMKQIHNDGENKWRMPLFLHKAQSLEFLQPDLPETRYRELLAYEMPSTEMQVHPVFTIRSPKLRPDNLTKDAPWAWEGLPELEY